ncbi:MAG: hypothetical protein VXZ16_01115 [Bacteroidota bacterium]|nr:hypothetical protein [Bacteroidota bacterium]MEC8401182.1 hypothetical protein [Bacteroidota bacterium]
MEKQITAAALVLSVAGIGYLKAQQMERMAERAVLDAEAADVASRVHFELPHDRDAQTSDMDIVLDGADSHDAERDSLTFAWVQTEGPDVQLREEVPGRSSFTATPGKYTFELTVTDVYGGTATQQAKVAVHPEPNAAPQAEVSVYAREIGLEP